MGRGGSGEGMPAGVRPLTVGDPVIIGRYLLLGRLGTGGMGVVYLAEHPRGGLVALKTPHAVHLNDKTLRARFNEEISTSRRVVPFCTAAVIEDGVDRNRPYLITEYIRGPALNHVVSERGPLTPDLAYGVALGTAAALVAVHEAGLVHRDLKPSNVLLSPRGPWVIDFGIARDLDTSDPLTQAGQVMGSPGWVAPERLTGGPAVPASDIFSWGCLVAYAATGHHPFGSGEADVLTRRILLEPPRLSAVPELLRPAVAAALAKTPEERPSAADLLRALLAAGGVGDPWDLREAVARVLGEIWTAVPHPVSAVASPQASAVRQAEETSPRRRRARQSAHVSHASFAALATVSIAALTVVAAAGGATGGFGAVSPPEKVPIIRPHGSAESTIRPIVAGTSELYAPSSKPRTTQPTVIVTRTATLRPSAVVNSRSMPGFEDGTPDGREDPPRDDCLNPAGKKRGNWAKRNCPEPSSSISTIPQEGPGEESPPPSPTPSGSITTIPQEGPGESEIPSTPASPSAG